MENGKKIGVLTSGGDCSGLNAIIRAVVNAASLKGWTVYGIHDGTDGLTGGELSYEKLTIQNFSDTPWPRLGGSYLGSLNKGIKMESLEEVSKRFAIGVPLTMGGTLSKSGPGVLELCGEARFIDGDPLTEPLTGTNVLSVAGPLKISSVDAVNGMSITLKSDATLRMDFRPQGAGMMETGFKMTRWATPFTVNTSDGRIPVVFDDGNPSIEDSVYEYRLPICTVAAAAANSVQFVIPKIKCHRLTVEQRTNNDGSVTLVAVYRKTGFRLSIR